MLGRLCFIKTRLVSVCFAGYPGGHLSSDFLHFIPLLVSVYFPVWCLEQDVEFDFIGFSRLPSQLPNSIMVKRLTHICLVNPSILINWTIPCPILGVSGVLFHFYSISNRYHRL